MYEAMGKSRCSKKVSWILPLLFLQLSRHFGRIDGFEIWQQKMTRRSRSRIGSLVPRFYLAASTDDNTYDDDDDDESMMMHISTQIPTASSPYWELGNSFLHFLNQCTIQSFLFLLKTCRDPQTLLWIEHFTEPIIDSDSTTMSALPGVPPGVVEGTGSYSSKLLSYHGLSAMNTTKFPSWQDYFMQLLQCPPLEYRVVSAAAHIPDYDHEIHPPRLCMRMLAVREQIAREFVQDLQVIAAQTPPPEQTASQSSSSSSTSRMQGAEFLFLEFAPDSESDYAPSPLRKGNFDLLVLLTTQESIHRLLNQQHPVDGPDPLDHDDSAVSDIALSSSQRSFVSNFYLHRLVSHFTGAQRYNRAQEFLQELLLAASTTEPSIVAKIYQERSRVAMEWKDVARSVPDAHVNIQKLLFQLMLKSNETKDDAFQ
jgi:hypothetical protein